MKTYAERPKVYFRVTTGDRVRFETLFLPQAEEFARGVYRETKQIADIDEVQVGVLYDVPDVGAMGQAGVRSGGLGRHRRDGEAL